MNTNVIAFPCYWGPWSITLDHECCFCWAQLVDWLIMQGRCLTILQSVCTLCCFTGIFSRFHFCYIFLNHSIFNCKISDKTRWINFLDRTEAEVITSSGWGKHGRDHYNVHLINSCSVFGDAGKFYFTLITLLCSFFVKKLLW